MNEEEVVNTFLSIVFDTLEADLKKMMSHPRGLDFGIISLVCSGIELLGALDRGTISNSEGRFGEALQKYFPARYSRYTKTLYRLFRHGLAHQAFIKPGTATARDPDYRQYHLWGVLVDGEEALFIHPDVFAEDYFKGVKEFSDSLSSNPRKAEVAFSAIKKLYKARRSVGEPVELHASLPDDGLDITRLPLPKWMAGSDVTVGSIELAENDT